MPKQLAIVTKYFVPYSNVDSNAVYDLICLLLDKEPDLDIQVVTSASDYRTNIKLRNFDENILDRITVHHIKNPAADFDSKFLKLLFGIVEGFRLIRHAKKLNIESIITLTNPALIIFWALRMLQNRKLIYWSFDLYPDAFVADGLVKESNSVYKLVERWTYNRSPYGILALGEGQFDYLAGKFGEKKIKKFILPCGIHNVSKFNQPPEWYHPDKINLAYIGNIGKAHSVEFLKNAVQSASQKEKINLILSIYGYHADEIRRFIEVQKIKNITITQSVKQSEMAYVDVHLVSLNHSWTHISVPSKAVSAVCSGGAIVFNGSKESDIWQMFIESSSYVTTEMESIDAVLEGLTLESVQKQRAASGEMSKKLLTIEKETVEELISVII